MKNGKNGLRSGHNSSFSQPPLTREEEYELFERIRKGDKRAEDVVVRAHYGFVCDTASHYRGPDWDDLAQEGSMGMLVAIGKFDHTMGNRFITYAGFWVRAYMIMAVRRHYESTRSPGSCYVVMRELRKQRSLYTNLYGRLPTVEESSELLGMRKSTIVKTLNCDKPMPSIGSARDGDNVLGWRLNHEVIADTETPSPLDHIEEQEKKEFLKSIELEFKKALKKSHHPERDFDIAFKHLMEGVNLSELGRRHNISRERARQIHLRSVRILRRILIKRKSEFTDLCTQL